MTMPNGILSGATRLARTGHRPAGRRTSSRAARAGDRSLVQHHRLLGAVIDRVEGRRGMRFHADRIDAFPVPFQK